jgi:DNA-damage-inducible protein J
MATDTVVRARIDGRVKEQAAGVLAEMGLSVSDAIRMLLVRIAAEKALPFEAKVPNATTEAAFRASDRNEGITRAKDTADMFRKLGI